MRGLVREGFRMPLVMLFNGNKCLRESYESWTVEFAAGYQHRGVERTRLQEVIGGKMIIFRKGRGWSKNKRSDKSIDTYTPSSYSSM